MRHWITLYVVSKEIVRKLVSSRKFVKESIMRSQAFVVRRSLRQLVSANINLRNYNEKELNLIREVDCRKAVASLFW